METEDDGQHWPKPPSCVPANHLRRPPNGARVTVAGLVLVRQRPATAKGVIFVTLEDETGTANIIIWKNVFEKYRRQVMISRLMKVTGKLQREGDVVHVIAHQIEDISHLLDKLLENS